MQPTRKPSVKQHVRNDCQPDRVFASVKKHSSRVLPNFNMDGSLNDSAVKFNAPISKK